MTLHDFINKEQRINVLRDVLLQKKVCDSPNVEKQCLLSHLTNFLMWEMDDLMWEMDDLMFPGDYINLDILNKFINKEADKFRQVFKDKILSYFPKSSEEFMNLFCNAKDLTELYVMFSRVKISECSEDFQNSLSYSEEEEKEEMEKDKYCMQMYLFRNSWDYFNGQIVPLPEKEEERDDIAKPDIIILYTKSRLVLLKREKGEERKQVLVILL